jgi:predicted amidophosphoribosyltransferase
MATAADITDPLIRTYTRVLPVQPGICDLCHGAPGVGWERCWSCAHAVGQVSRPIELVLPISLTELLGQLHHVLRSYKRDDYPEAVRVAFRVQLGALLARFLAAHGDCIRQAAGEEWDIITIVPSSKGRAGVHPLESVVQVFRSLSDLYQPLLASGPDPADHNQASDEAYVITTDVRGLRVLLIDDTFTSGARLQSAASTLQLAGALVVAAVPIGRVINAGFSAESAAALAKAKERPFDFGVCGLER